MQPTVNSFSFAIHPSFSRRLIPLQWLVITSFVLSLLMYSTASAQLWAGILDRSRATDWTAAGVTGGIPNRANQCGQTIAPYTGSSATINAAIQSCSNGGGGVVQLAPGTFNLSDSIGFNNSSSPIGNSAQDVTLRGAGPDQTFLVFSGQGRGNGGAWCGQGGLICVSSAVSASPSCGYPYTPNTGNWTANYSAGTTEIVLDNISGNGNVSNNLTVGMYLTLDQLDNPNTAISAYVPFVTSDSTAAYMPCNAQRTGRCLAEYHKVVSISGTGPYIVTVTPAIAYAKWNMDGNNRPQAWWCENVKQRALNDGVENLSIENRAAVNDMRGGIIQFYGAAQSWMKNVRQLYGQSASVATGQMTHVHVTESANIEIRDSYFYSIVNPSGCGTASTQYGIEPVNTGLLKVENNIFQQGCSAYLAQPCYVCVWGYNFSVGDLNQMLSGPYVFWAGGPGHTGGNHLLLWEGNDLNAFSTDHAVGHGTNAMYLTAFRNRFTGVQPSNPINTGQIPNSRIPVHNQAFNRFNSYIGNVLGDPSLAAARWVYQSYPGFGTDPGTNSERGTIFAIGWGKSTVNDSITKTSLLRWGNFDYVTNGVRWCGNSSSPGFSTTCGSVTEIPSDNFVPSTTVLPASFYLQSKPGWFTSIAFPVIGPDVTNGNDTSRHAGTIPAKSCYLNVMRGPADGSGAVLTFNAANCYGLGGNESPPAPPTGLRVS
jgi:hypothetical protein